MVRLVPTNNRDNTMQRVHNPESEFERSPQGIVTFWALVTIPIFLIMLCIILEIGNLWLARIQLKNALEAGALAAVKNWGDAGGGDTNLSRMVGNQFASSLVVNGRPVDLTTDGMATTDSTLNYNAANGNNQNGSCTGVFVFGAITSDSPEYTFDSCVAGGCGGPGDVMVDASALSNLANTDHNDWGVSIQPTAQSVAGTFVTRVTIRLPPTFAGGNPVFDFSQIANFPAVSTIVNDNDGGKVQCSSSGGGGQINCPPDQGDAQADVFGISPGSISFGLLSNAQFGDDGSGGRLECAATPRTIVPADPLNNSDKVLVILFPGTGDLFEVEERIRFSALVSNGVGGSPYGGDDIGQMAAQVTVCFNAADPVTGTMIDTTQRLTGNENFCSNVSFASWGQCTTPGRHGMIMNFGGGVDQLRPDQPPPPSNGVTGNGQSVLTLNNSTGGTGYAVRAQATYKVPSICKNLFGLPIADFSVTAKTDAIYECTTSLPRIYHLDDADFTCAAPCP